GRKDGSAHTADGREHLEGSPASGDGVPLMSRDFATGEDLWRRATGSGLRTGTARECPLVSASDGDAKERHGPSKTRRRRRRHRHPESRKRPWLGLFPLTQGTKC